MLKKKDFIGNNYNRIGYKETVAHRVANSLNRTYLKKLHKR